MNPIRYRHVLHRDLVTDAELAAVSRGDGRVVADLYRRVAEPVPFGVERFGIAFGRCDAQGVVGGEHASHVGWTSTAGFVLTELTTPGSMIHLQLLMAGALPDDHDVNDGAAIGCAALENHIGVRDAVRSVVEFSSAAANADPDIRGLRDLWNRWCSTSRPRGDA